MRQPRSQQSPGTGSPKACLRGHTIHTIPYNTIPYHHTIPYHTMVEEQRDIVGGEKACAVSGSGVLYICACVHVWQAYFELPLDGFFYSIFNAVVDFKVSFIIQTNVLSLCLHDRQAAGATGATDMVSTYDTPYK